MLYKQKVYKADKVYTDLYLIWHHEGKSYKVRVEPRFQKDKVLLLSQAKELEAVGE
jgi:hypothetical protein